MGSYRESRTSDRRGHPGFTPDSIFAIRGMTLSGCPVGYRGLAFRELLSHKRESVVRI